jgi:hypothetical protein
MSDKLKLLISYGVNFGVLLAALFVEEIRQLPSLLVLALVTVLAGVQSATGNTIDYIREKTSNERLRRQATRLRLNQAQTRRQLDEFQQIVLSFLEHSQIYRERIKDQLKLTEDYLCIVKSSEGLSDVFTSMERKEMLPFGALLMRIPGTIRPFENIGMFLVPITSLPGINEWNVRAYIDKAIIPEVENEREAFLARLPRRVSKRAEPLSYKYLAFLLRRGAIAHGVQNRKFNREFNASIVESQSSADFSTMKDALAEMVRARDLLALVNWASFARLNEEQRALVERHRESMSAQLREAGIESLATLAETDHEQVLNVIWPVLVRRTTKRKALNISKRVVEGARTTVEVLRRNGITL